MRRLLPLLLAAGPLAAAAQTSGTITFSPTSVNAADCPSTTATVSLSWTTTFPSGSFATGGSYTLSASSTQQTGTTTPYCGSSPTTLVTTPSTIDNSSATVSGVTVLAKDLAAAAGLSACTADGKIYVCVSWKDSASNEKGYARGTLALEVTPPAAPTVSSVWPGDGALVVDVTDNSTTPAATSWRVKAVAADAIAHYSGWETSKSGIRVEGLANGTPYTVTAFAKSDAGNESAESAAFGTQVAPQPVRDFFDVYVDSGGRDTGGCGSGPAGLLALLGAASVLWIRRRS